MPDRSEKPFFRVESMPGRGRTLVEAVIELKTLAQRPGAEPDTFLRSVDYALNLADEFERVNPPPAHPGLGIQGREKLVVVVYREMVLGKHPRGEHNGR